MAKQGRRRKTSKRPSFECLERRKLLSAVAPAPIGLLDGFAPPVVLGDLHPHRAEAADFMSAGTTALRGADLLAPSGITINTMLPPAVGNYLAEGDHLELSFSNATPVCNSSAGLMTVSSEMAIAETAESSPAISQSLHNVIAAPRETYMAPMSPVITAIAYDVRNSILSVVFVSAAPVMAWSPPQIAGADIRVSMSEAESGSGQESATNPASVALLEVVTNASPIAAPPMEVGHPAIIDKVASQVSLPIMPAPNASHMPPSVADGFDYVGDHPLLREAPAFVGPANRSADAPASPYGKADSTPVAEAATAATNRRAELLPERAAAASERSIAADGNVAALTAVSMQNEATYRENTTDAVNSGEGGFLAIDNGTVPRLGTGESDTSIGDSGDTGKNDLGGVLSSGPHKAASPTSGEYAPSGKIFADASGSARAQAEVQESPESIEGGAIDLADATVAGATGSSVAGDSGDAGQGISGVPRESGVGLFCDMEVAVGGSPDGSENVASSAERGAAMSTAANRQGVPGSRLLQGGLHRAGLRQGASAGVTDNVPLFFGATVIVLTSGVYLEREPDEERRIRTIQRVRNRPRN